jgi:hypothetical protein
MPLPRKSYSIGSATWRGSLHDSLRGLGMDKLLQDSARRFPMPANAWITLPK